MTYLLYSSFFLFHRIIYLCSPRVSSPHPSGQRQVNNIIYFWSHVLLMSWGRTTYSELLHPSVVRDQARGIQKDGAVLPCMLKMILLDKCEITSNYKVNVSECNQIITMDNDMIFTTYNDLVIILYIMTLSKSSLKFSPSLIGLFI